MTHLEAIDKSIIESIIEGKYVNLQRFKSLYRWIEIFNFSSYMQTNRAELGFSIELSFSGQQI